MQKAVMRSGPTKPKVFISHSSRDRKTAETLCSALENRGVKCWIATRDVSPGENFQDSIVSSIESSCAMILVFSHNSNNSNEIKKEIALAGQYLVPIIPVRVEDVLPSGAFRYELVTRQWIDLFSDWESAVERIVLKIRELTESVNAPAPADSPLETQSDEGQASGFQADRGKRRRRKWQIPAALSIVPASLLAAFYYNRDLVPSDPPAAYAETPATRLMSFTMRTPPTEYKSGLRSWSRVTSDRWIEKYPDGTQTAFSVIGRTRVYGCDGTILTQNTNAQFQIFLPDKSCMEMKFLFRRLPDRGWVTYVDMDDVT